MNMLSIGVLAVIAVILSLTIRPKNGEIALMLTLSCSVLILLSVFSRASEIIGTVNSIVAASQTNISYIVILLKVIGICLLTEFAVNTCRDAGSQSLAEYGDESHVIKKSFRGVRSEKNHNCFLRCGALCLFREGGVRRGNAVRRFGDL